MLHLRTLGALDLKGPDGVVLQSVLLQPKRAAILVYLAVARPRGVHQRDELLALFWPESDERSARHSLSQALYALRRSLGTDTLRTAGRDGIAVDPHAVRCDAVAFEAAVDSGRWTDALELYAGPFLHGFHSPEADGFDRWADGERERLRTEAAGAAWAAAREALELGQPVEAERRAHQAIRLLPTNEAAVAAFLRALCDAGDRGGAARFYRRWAVLLSEELELEPSAETAALARDLTDDPHAPSGPTLAPFEGGIETPPRARARTEPDARPEERRHRSWRGRVPGRAVAAAALLLLGWVASALVSDAVDRRVHPLVELSTLSGEGQLGVERSIAVLPFTVVSPDSEAVRWVAYGVREEICEHLTELPGLTVRPPETVSRVYGAGEKALVEIAAELRVTALLLGSVRIIGDRFRLAVRLVGVDGRTTLWQGTYESGYTTGPAMFDIQTEVAERIAAALGAEPTEDQRARIERRSTRNARAWALYHQGRFQENKATPESLHKAVALYNQAIDEDPGFGRPYAGIASAYGLLAQVERWPPEEHAGRVTAAAERALRIDSTLAEPYRILGQMKTLTWDFEGAEQDYQTALRLEPNEARTHLFYAQHLNIVGRHEEALERVRRAQEIDPVDPFIASNVSARYYYARRYDEALAEGLKALELDPRHWVAHWLVGVAYSWTGRHDRAIAELKLAVERSEGGVDALMDLGAAYARAGRRAQAEAVARELIDLAAATYVHPSYIAYVYAALGETNEALERLEQAYRERDLYLVWILVDPVLEPLRPDPRLQALMHGTGLSEYITAERAADSGSAH